MVDLARRRMFSRLPKAQISTENPQRMPWLVDEQAFVDGCTRCDKCISVCETAIIVKGDAGFPEVDFNKGECTFCRQCADVCPEPLFTPRDEQPWKQVVRIKDTCLSLQGIECRICGENCEYAAIKFRLQVGGTAKPQLSEPDCTGCGGCIKPCPANAIEIIKQEA